ncbi:MAG: polysaccharide deacetylase family protein [Muribaculum sp.]
MFIEQPPLLYRILFPEAVWRIKRKKRKVIYLTFDDGPIPEVTPWVLDVLDHYGIKATFFSVGDNVRRHPELLEEIKRRGHSWGNHTMNHLQGFKVTSRNYLRNIKEADNLIDSNLYRPPHGIMRWSQAKVIKDHFNIIMYDLVTRDYSKKLNGEQVLNNVKKFARNGSIIVFHDSLKAERNLRYALPRAIEWLKEQGYEFEAINM